MVISTMFFLLFLYWLYQQNLIYHSYFSFLPDDSRNRIMFSTLEPGCYNVTVQNLLEKFGTMEILKKKIQRNGFPNNFPINNETAPLIASELSKRNYTFSESCIGHTS